MPSMSHAHLKNGGYSSRFLPQHQAWYGNREVFWACMMVLQLTIEDVEPVVYIQHGIQGLVIDLNIYSALSNQIIHLSLK